MVDVDVDVDVDVLASRLGRVEGEIKGGLC